MDARRIKTLVKNDHTLGKDVFVLGRIMGAMAVMCIQGYFRERGNQDTLTPAGA